MAPNNAKRLNANKSWDYMFGQLLKYKEVHGDCLVPAKYEPNERLSRWVQTQRSARKKTNGSGGISKERIKKLNSLGFVWSVNEALWNNMYDALVEYKERYGTCVVPQSYPQLGTWVDRQRTDKNDGRLSSRRQRKLEELGFVWRVSHDSWHAMYERLLAFKADHGHCQVPQKYAVDPKLGNWVDKQRYLHNSKNLTQERMDLLNEAGFTWAVATESWESNYAQLKKFKSIHGSCMIYPEYKDEKLQKWVKEQRKKKTRMSEERRARLDALGFVWSVPQACWETMYQNLVQYKERNGNCLVPKRYPENPQLGRWVHNQRVRKRDLPLDRKKKLDSIGFYESTKKSPAAAKRKRLSKMTTTSTNMNMDSCDAAIAQIVPEEDQGRRIHLSSQQDYVITPETVSSFMEQTMNRQAVTEASAGMSQPSFKTSTYHLDHPSSAAAIGAGSSRYGTAAAAAATRLDRLNGISNTGVVAIHHPMTTNNSISPALANACYQQRQAIMVELMEIRRCQQNLQLLYCDNLQSARSYAQAAAGSLYPPLHDPLMMMPSSTNNVVATAATTLSSQPSLYDVARHVDLTTCNNGYQDMYSQARR